MSKWILYDADHIGTTNCKCPVCKTEFFFPRIAVDPYRYCPNCGQFMLETCTTCKWEFEDVHSEYCDGCCAGEYQPTHWQPKSMKTDCQW